MAIPQIDMTYRFTWDTEPTEEQLAQLMEECAEKVRQQSERLAQKHQEYLQKGYVPAAGNFTHNG